MQWNTKVALVLAICAIMESINPVPVLTMFLIYVLLVRPPYVKAWVDQLYSDSSSS
jgi:hypothetical protein